MSALTTPQMPAQCPLSQSYLINAHDGTVREAGEMCGIRACSELLGAGERGVAQETLGSPSWRDEA